MEKNGVVLETELRLGLPGGGSGEVEKNEKKRVFDGSAEKAVMHKNQVVGWPPVAAFRRKSSFDGGRMNVKVSMDGAPFLRKVDVNMHKGYSELVRALEELFGCFGIGEALKEDKEKCEYVPIYEDKDGDWMLLGDVPWEMFTESCKRLRIMKRAEEKGVKYLLKGIPKSSLFVLSKDIFVFSPPNYYIL